MRARIIALMNRWDIWKRRKNNGNLYDRSHSSGFLILITCAVIFCKDILSAAIIYSAFSFCAVLLYLMMGSPDVAFTEAVIGTISTIFFVASLKKIDRWCK